MSEITELNNANRLTSTFPVSGDQLTWLAIAFTVLATTSWLAVNDAVWWSSANASVWSSDIWSRSNSQHPLDPYTLTHMMHGVLCYLSINILAKRLPLSRQFFLAILFACGWELVENSPFFIERYRIVTAASEYIGDALINSMTDIAACALGFYLATRVKFGISVAIFILVEILMMIWVRDNLFLNVIMIVFPVDSIRHWQIGV